ncbi:MAG: sugar ABC transporter permease [Chloroflexia bacterium]|nr:sugar ABC transporter permease [Chloroflexia bacterium]
MSSEIGAFPLDRAEPGRRQGTARRRRLGPYLVMLPALLFLLAVSIVPLLYSLVVSLLRYNLMNPDRTGFIGLRNFQLILASPEFWNSLLVTVQFVVIAVGLELVLGLGLALVLSRDVPGIGFFRSFLLVPLALAPVVVGLLWRFMLNTESGILNWAISLLGFSRTDFLSNTTLALPVIALVDVWQWTPFMFLILLAAIQALPPEPFEAAAIDGASTWETIRHIALPMLRYPILVAVLLRTIDAFRVYDLIFMMTRGGPVTATDTLSWSVYNNGFRNFNMGYAAALSWIILIIVSVVVAVFVRLLAGRAGETA